MSEQITKIGEEDGRRPELTAPPSKSPMATLGMSGTAIYGGHVQPFDSDSRLTGIRRYKTFSEILANVSIVAAGVRYFLNLIAKAEWKFEPADESPRAVELAERVEAILNGMETPWHRVVRRAAMYRFYGFGILEWTAKKEGAEIVFLDVESRAPVTIERWDTDVHGKVLGCLQRSPQTAQEIYLPREKIVYLVDDSLSDSPEGLGLFRHLVKAAARLERYQQLEGFGFEGDLRGIPIVRAPLTALAQLVKAGDIEEETANALLQPLKDFVTNHTKNPNLGMLLDSQTWQTSDERKSPSSSYQFDAELLDGGTYAFEGVAEAIRRVNLEMARVLSVEHLLLGEGSVGSHALSEDKSANFAIVVDSTLKELREQFEADLLRPLFKLNGWPPELMPTMATDTNASRKVSDLTGGLRDLASAGLVLDREDEAVAEIFRLMGLPRLVGDLDLTLDPLPLEAEEGRAPAPADPDLEDADDSIEEGD